MKKSISMLLCICMLLSLFSGFGFTFTFAASDPAEMSVNYTELFDANSQAYSNTLVIIPSLGTSETEVSYYFGGQTVTETYSPSRHFASYADALAAWNTASTDSSVPNFILTAGTYTEEITVSFSANIYGAQAGVTPNDPDFDTTAALATDDWGENPARSESANETVLTAAICRSTETADAEGSVQTLNIDGVKMTAANAIEISSAASEIITVNNINVRNSVFSGNTYGFYAKEDESLSKLNYTLNECLITGVTGSFIKYNAQDVRFNRVNMENSKAVWFGNDTTNEHVTNEEGGDRYVYFGATNSRFANCSANALYGLIDDNYAASVSLVLDKNIFVDANSGSYGIFRVDSDDDGTGRHATPEISVTNNLIYSSTQKYTVFNGGDPYQNAPFNITFNKNRVIGYNSPLPNNSTANVSLIAGSKFDFDYNYIAPISSYTGADDWNGQAVAWSTNYSGSSIIDVSTVRYYFDYAMTTANVTDGLTIASDPDTASYAGETYLMSEKLSAVPHTFEATVHVPTSMSSNAGCILGNYQGYTHAYVNLYVYSNGNPRFLYRDSTNNQFDIVFTGVDVRSYGYVHLAVVVDSENGQIHCYKDGELAETKQLYPDIDSGAIAFPFAIGGDHRTMQEGGAYFKGQLKSVAMYSDVRSAEEIKADMTAADKEDENLLVSYSLSADKAGADIADESKNGNTLKYSDYYLTEAEKVAAFGDTPEYEYSIAVVGDLHTAHHMSNDTEKANFNNFFKWLADNTDDKNIQYVITTGDITDVESDEEYVFAQQAMSAMDGVVDYSLIQGNHDFYAGGSAYTSSGGTLFDEYYADYEPYTKQFDQNGGYYQEGSVENTWRTLKAGSTDWLLINLDFGANDDILAWAGEIIEAHPNHKVIITTHEYLFADGTLTGNKDAHASTTYNSAYNNGEDIWYKLASLYENVEIVISGHQMCDDTVVTQTKGVHGNTVTQFLINPQQVNTRKDFLGIVSMFYFSKDGRTVTIENYATSIDGYFKNCNMLTVDLDADCEELTEDWEGSMITPKGSGTKSDPYIIENAGNLVWMSENCVSLNSTGHFDGQYFEQTKDIDLCGRSIRTIGYYHNFASDSNFTNGFSGIYDGNGYSIKNGFIKPYAYYDHEFNRYYGHGLFGAVYGATIKNVTLDNIQILGQGVTGGIVGIASSPRGTASSQYNLITNCEVKENCNIIPRLTRTNTNTSSTSYDNVYTAGMAGGIVGTSVGTTVSYCTSAVKIRFDGTYTMVGGVVAGAGHNSVIDHCVFSGKLNLIDNTAKATSSVGGILGATTPNANTGSASSTHKTGSFTISNCVNTGTIEYTGEKLKKNIHIGGVIGFAGMLKAADDSATAPSYTDTPTYLMDNCYNLYARTTVDSYGAEYWSGGLIGKAQIYSAAEWGNLWLRDSYSVDIAEKYTNGASTSTNEFGNQNCKSTYGFYGAEIISDADGNATVGTKTAQELEAYAQTIYDEIEQNKADSAETIPEKPEGKGTKESPYLVKNINNLAWMSANIVQGAEATFDGVYFKQTNDIDLGGQSITSIGYYYSSDSDMAAFGGHYDGCGYTVKNGKIAAYSDSFAFNRKYGYGLFGMIHGATVENINLDGIEVIGHGVTGAIVGKASALDDGSAECGFNLIKNCSVSSSCKITMSLPTGASTSGMAYDNNIRAGMVGGICGMARATEISYCVSEMELKLSGTFTHIGGIAASAGYNSLIDHCVTRGGIALTDTASTQTVSFGGILGIVNPSNLTSDVADKDQGTLRVTNCVNYGYFKYTGTSKHSKNLQMGGIIGFAGRLFNLDNGAYTSTAPCDMDDIPSFLMENCYNMYSKQEDTVTSSNAGYWTSGLLGKAQTSTGNSESTLWLRNCYSVDGFQKASNGKTGDQYNYENWKTTYGLYSAEVVKDAEGNATVGTKTADEIALLAAEIEDDITIYNNGWAYNKTTKTLTVSKDLGDFAVKTAPWYEYANDVKAIVVEEGVTEIGAWAFNYCFNATTVSLPSTLKTIGINAFYRCQSLTEVVIPESVDTIKSGAFSYCYALQKVSIPEAVTVINTYTFYDCNKLVRATYAGTEDALTVKAHNGILADVLNAGEAEELTFSWKVENGVLTLSGNTFMPDYTSKTAPWYAQADEITAIVIEDGIKSIGEYAFAYLANAKTVEIADSVKTISLYAFYGAGLTEVEIPASVTTLGNGAFTYNRYLTKVEIPAAITEIKNYTFYGCDKLETAIYSGDWDALKINIGNDPLINASREENTVPKAQVNDLGELDVTVTGGEEYTLETAYCFTATETFEEVNANSEYKYYHADFVVSFDKDVTDITLAGYYDEYAEAVGSKYWVPMLIENAKAGDEIRLLDTYWYVGEGSISYQELCVIEQFLCGALDVNDNDTGAKMTVELRLYEVTENSPSTSVETGEYVTAGIYEYTF